MMTYDQWKTRCPEDEFSGDEFSENMPPPCELPYAGRMWAHPRYPSGDCVECGALCTESCKHKLAVGEWEPEEP